MATNEIAVNSVGALALDPGQTEWTTSQMAALEQMGIANAPMGDQLVFLHYAQKTGLDPFARQIHMIGRMGWDPRARQEVYKYTIQVGIDGLRVVAERTGRYEGRTPIQWCGEDGEWRNVWLDRRRKPVAARCAVYKQGFTVPIEAVAHFEEFAQTKKGGELNTMWATKGAHMIAKVAEALALRAAFPQDLSGIYIPEEMADAEQPTGGRGEPGERITPTSAEEYSQPSGTPMISTDQLSRLGALCKELTYGRDEALALCAEVAGRDVPRSNLLTRDEAEQVIAALKDRLAPVAEVVEDAPADVWRDLVDASELSEEELTRRYESDHDRHPSTVSAAELREWAEGGEIKS